MKALKKLFKKSLIWHFQRMRGLGRDHGHFPNHHEEREFKLTYTEDPNFEIYIIKIPKTK